MKKFIAPILLTLVLTACGGGGGSNPIVRPDPAPTGNAPPVNAPAPVNNVPVANTPASYSVGAPALVSIINPLVAASTFGSVLTMYNSDLTGTGVENVVVAGNFNGAPQNRVDSKITVFGWNNGQLVEQSSQWFNGTDNVINGTARISFGNFNGNGRSSMFTVTGTDGQMASLTAQMFVNNGSSFTRYNIALDHPLDSPDSTVFNYNGVDNAVAIGFPYTQVVMGSNTNNFRAYSVINTSGSSITSGNFLGNGSPSFVIGQYGSSTCLGCTPDALVGFNFDQANNTVTMPFIRNMPVPLFNSTQQYLNQTGGSNTIKVVKFDFDGSGVDSVFITAMPNNWQASPYQSSIQFLKNNGAGVFTDVTATTVTGYDMTKGASTNPVIVDLLNTGLPDIVLPTSGGTQVLMQVSKGKFVASMANTITDFQNQVQTLINNNPLTSNQTSQNASFTFVKGPNNNLYMLDMVPMTVNGTAQTAFYLSSISNSTVALNAKQVLTTARTIWPYLTDVQLNSMITATANTFAGVPIIDPQAVFTPFGSLKVLNQPITGAIAGVDVGNLQVTAMDQLGRNFTVNMAPSQVTGWRNALSLDSEHIDQYELTSHTEYLVNSYVNNLNGMRIGVENKSQLGYSELDRTIMNSILPPMNNYTVGIPRVWSGGKWSGGAQYTSLNYNPLLTFNGSWGKVNQSQNFDTTIRYTDPDGFNAVLGTTLTTTQITPGIINKVDSIVSMWGEVGYRYNDFGIYAGVKPVPVAGGVEAVLPTAVDMQGNLQYTKQKMALSNQATEYVRALYTTNVNKNTWLRVGGTVMSNGQYRVLNELRITF